MSQFMGVTFSQYWIYEGGLCGCVDKSPNICLGTSRIEFRGPWAFDDELFECFNC